MNSKMLKGAIIALFISNSQAATIQHKTSH